MYFAISVCLLQQSQLLVFFQAPYCCWVHICLSHHRTVGAHLWSEAMKIHSTCNCFSTYTCFRNFHSGPGLGQSCKSSCGHSLFVSQEHFFWYSFVQKEASCIFGALMLLMQIKEKSGGATGLVTSTLLIQANPSMQMYLFHPKDTFSY